ncbi:MAG TPA: hypothetical protein VGF08_11375 [Terriglobales bacterium]
MPVVLAACLAGSAGAATTAPEVVQDQLGTGYRHLYNLDFPRAQQAFTAWEQQHRDNPMGPVSEAAGLLFAEFDRLGVLESQFYESDAAFAKRKKLSPDPEVRKKFDALLERAEQLSRAGLAKDPKDHDGLFGLTLASGLKADYAALIEKRNTASLRYTKESTAWANQLLAVHSDCYDAHLANGISRYLVGSMAAPVRWFLRLTGVSGDKQAGIDELRLTAEKGRYLAPFARILLAIAYVREKDKPRARSILASLQEEFPGNPLFAREIARLDGKEIRGQ